MEFCEPLKDLHKFMDFVADEILKLQEQKKRAFGKILRNNMVSEGFILLKKDNDKEYRGNNKVTYLKI